MPKLTPPLTLKGVIPDKSSALTFGGGKGDSVRLILDLYSEDQAELLRLVNLRGERLYVTFIREEDVERSRREPSNV